MYVNRFAEVNGLRLHYLDHGNEGAPALVCIHGLTGNAHHFDAIAPQFAHAYHVISLDVRGRGDSQWGPPQNYAYTQYVSDLAGFLDLLGIDTVNLLGTSMGGIISMMYAGSYPDRVARLALNDIGPEFNSAGVARIANDVPKAPLEFRDLDEVAQYYRMSYPPMANLQTGILLQFCRWAVKQGENGRWVWKMDPAARQIKTNERVDLWAMYRRITSPVLVIRGSESDLLSPATTERMRAAHAKTRVVEVPGVGHAPFLTEPEALTGLKEFFAC